MTDIVNNAILLIFDTDRPAAPTFPSYSALIAQRFTASSMGLDVGTDYKSHGRGVYIRD